MTALRRFAAPLLALLGLLVVAQMLDVLPCADEGAPTAQAAHAADGPDGCDPGEGASPDCLCHVLFAPTDAVPAVAVAGETPRPPFVPYDGRRGDADPVPVEHVPIG